MSRSDIGREADVGETDAEAKSAPGVRAAAFELAATLAREGLKMTTLPALALPPRLRRGVFGTARLASRASSVLPRPFGEALEGLADHLDEMEAAVSHREDLGSRLRREGRRSGRNSPASQ